jgi:hypothetical protein
MRERGELQDMRALLSEGITEIESVSDDEFMDVGRKVEYNIEQAFKKHSFEVEELSRHYRNKYAIDAVSVAVSGTIGFVAMYPTIAQSIGFLSSGLFESYSVSRLIRDYYEEREKFEFLKRKPVGMLFQAKKTG